METIIVRQFWTCDPNSKGYEFPFVLVDSWDEYTREDNETGYEIARQKAMKLAVENNLEFREIDVEIPVNAFNDAFSSIVLTTKQ